MEAFLQFLTSPRFEAVVNLDENVAAEQGRHFEGIEENAFEAFNIADQ